MLCAAQKNIFGNLAWPHATVQLEFKREGGAPVKTVTVKAKGSETETLPLFTNKDGVRGEVSSAGLTLSSSCVCKDAFGSCMQRPGLPPAVRRSKLQMCPGRRWSTRGSRCSCWARSSSHQSAATRTTLCRLVRSCPTSAAFEPIRLCAAAPV